MRLFVIELIIFSPFAIACFDFGRRLRASSRQFHWPNGLMTVPLAIGKIIEVLKMNNGHENFRLQSSFGVLDVTYGGKELKPSDTPIDETVTTRIGVAAAAFKFNNRSTQASGSCKCKSSCLTKMCSCLKGGYACTTHCHPFNTKCENTACMHDDVLSTTITTQTKTTQVITTTQEIVTTEETTASQTSSTESPIAQNTNKRSKI